MTGLRAHANKRDLSEPKIVEALEKAGATVYKMDRPVDLLVHFRGRNHLVECKTGKKGLTSDQEEFIKTWPGPVFILRTPQDAVDFLNGDAS